MLVGAERERKLIPSLLAAGASWVELSSPERALETQRVRTPAMYLVDSASAALDGGKIFSRLREHPLTRHIPRVLLANHQTAAELIESAFQHGLDDCLVTPFSESQIRARLAALAPEPGPARLAPLDRNQARRVLLVGGETAYRQLLDELLQLSGFQVLASAEVPPAEVLAQAGPFHSGLLIADVHAPGELRLLNALARALASAAGRPPLLVISPDSAHRSSGSTGGVNYELIDRQELPEVILGRLNARLNRPTQYLRVEARVPFFCPVEFREAGGISSGPWSSGYSFDISVGGIFVRTLVPIRVRAALEVKITLPTTGEHLNVTGVCAWANHFAARRVFSYPVGMGVEFLGADRPGLSKGMSQLLEVCRTVAHS